MECASSRIGLKFSSRVIRDSKMFIALLRVEIVFEAYMSRLLTLASPPKTRSPPVFGQVKAVAGAAAGGGIEAGAATGWGAAAGCVAGGAGAAAGAAACRAGGAGGAGWSAL